MKHAERTQLSLFWLLALAMLWLTHAIGYLMHEYAHTFTAWLLHAKANPFALDYGHLTVNNILLQSDIDEDVDYAPIFAAGRNHVAALIAVAGVLIGNGLSYLISRGLLARARRNGAHASLLFAFLLCVMSVGNFLSYVPLRTFTTHADMATTTRGLDASPWVIALGLGIPFAVALLHFFEKILPTTGRTLFPGSYISQCVFVVLTTFLVFDFFGSAGMRNYGDVSHVLSVVCVYVLFPVVTLLYWPRSRPFYASTRP
jgi:hypothetical protein